MKPMLAKISNEKILSSKEYIFEPKLDGYRAFYIKNKTHKIFTRNNIDITNEFKELDLNKSIDAHNCILDGEIIVYDTFGNPSFSLIQKRKSQELKATYVVFDILKKENKDLKNLPLLRRKEILSEIIKENNHIQLMVYTEKSEELKKLVKKRKIEGIMAKKKHSIYKSTRSSDWLKIKFIKSIDCIIIGYTKKRRQISSLALGLYEKNQIKFIGKVGTGFDQKQIIEIKKLLQELPTHKLSKEIISVDPINVCEVKYHEMTSDQKLRAPVFIRLRQDKSPQECKFKLLQQQENAK